MKNDRCPFEDEDNSTEIERVREEERERDEETSPLTEIVDGLRKTSQLVVAELASIRFEILLNEFD